jgi:hypothetical protein
MMMRALLIITASVLALASDGNVALAQSDNPNPMVESNPNPAIQSNENENTRELHARESMARLKVRQRVSAAVAALESIIRELQHSPDPFGGRRGLALASSRQALADLKRVLEYHEPPPPPANDAPSPARRGR